ncbi:MAG: hypothetical protein ACYSUM_06695 [Planctomycetota bacterium]|jgi:hypothetical protein
MKAVYWKELRELAAVWIILLVWAVIFAFDYGGWHSVLGRVLSLAIIGGIVTGAVQGLLDRWRRNDLFLAHRPLSPLRLQLARTLAGVTAWLAPALVFLLLFRVAAPSPFEGPFGRIVEPYLPNWTESLFLLGAMAASWALFRLIVGTRRLPAVLGLALVLPATLLAFWMRTSTLAAALGVSLVVALLCTTTTVLGLAGARRSILRAASLLLLGAIVLFECLGMLRWVTTDLALDTYPPIMVTGEGDVLFRNHAQPRPTLVHPVYRTYVRAGPVFGSAHTPPWEKRMSRGWSWHYSVLRTLNDLEEGRRQVGFAPIVWRYEEGRFLCRHGSKHHEVLAGFGPGGYVVGPKAQESEPFEDPAQVLRWGADVFQWVTEQRLIVVDPPPVDHVARDSLEPVRVEISTRSLAESPRNAWPERLGDARFVVIGGRMLWVDRTGDVLFRVEWSPDMERHRGAVSLREFEKKSAGPAQHTEYLVPGPVVGWAVSSDVEPVHPIRCTVRIRVFRPDRPVLVEDIEVRPERASEHAAALLRGAVTLPLPVPIAIVSYLSGQTRTWEDLHTWTVRDPVFAGGTSTGWLLMSLALACVCAWWARKQTRMRCATEPAVRFWIAAAFLLGPLGLVWMYLVVGRETIERVGGAHRAVDLEASPATAEPWPEPRPTGTEVHA